MRGDSIQSGLFGSPSADLFSERRASSDGQDEPDGDDDESQYVPKHMRFV